MLLEDILVRVAAYPARLVTVTGGEPLAQPGCHELMSCLADSGYRVSLETAGALDIGGIDDRVSVVMDLKTPGSGEVSRNRYENIHLLKADDQVKFVICDRQDYDWAKFKIAEYGLIERVSDVLLSPSHDVVEPQQLAEWILNDGLQVRLQLQLHKLLWGDGPGV